MGCKTPLPGYFARERNESGKRSIVFDKNQAFTDRPVGVPCGNCIDCRLRKAQEWAVRLTHESQLHKASSFITLTYSDDFLPEDHSLSVVTAQRFMKRLRKAIRPDSIRFFLCGEYGEKTKRPHYHAIIFGHAFPDRIHHRNTKLGQPLYISETLDKVWPFGYHSIGDVTFKSAGYVARYATKKILGADADEYYCGRVPEFATMSRHPGIGADWFAKYGDDVYPHDYVILDGRKIQPPKFYDMLLEQKDPEMFQRVKDARKRAAYKAFSEDKPRPSKLSGQKVRTAKAAHLVRDLQ